MKTKFKIVEVLETGEIFLAKPYFLDNIKHTLFCKYKEGEKPIFNQWALGNEYNEDIKIIGEYETDDIIFSWENGIKNK